MQKYYPPAFKKREFHCIHCGVYAAQSWHKLHFINQHSRYQEDGQFDFCICEHCSKWSYWYKERMIVPSSVPVPSAHEDMPEECISDYEEARSIVAISPKAATALLRLTLQKLMVALGERGKNINDDIGSLVEKGLPIMVKQALDYCRVVGNNAVHPGEIEINDTPEIAHNLFTMMNFIVEDRISRPKQIQALYDLLPEGARVAVEKRDNPEVN